MPALFHNLAFEHDRNELKKGDGFDLKAGILLALTAVLVAINGALLADTPLTKEMQITQLASLALAATAALFTCIVVIYRNYSRPETPESFASWLVKLESLGLEEAARATATKEAREAFTRISKNRRINMIRYGWLGLGFFAAILSLILDVVTIALNALVRLKT